MNIPGIILVDDHTLFRSGLRYILESTGKFKIIAEASNGIEFLELLESITPQLVIMDIVMPRMNGIDATRIALSKYPDLKILILSMYSQSDYYNSMLDSGIKGFLQKYADNEEFINAINKILSGENYFAQELLLSIIKENTLNPSIKLSRREKEILELISRGLSNSEISGILSISQRTIERHRTHLLDKTGCKNSICLVIFALKNNLVSI